MKNADEKFNYVLIVERDFHFVLAAPLPLRELCNLIVFVIICWEVYR